MIVYQDSAHKYSENPESSISRVRGSHKTSLKKKVLKPKNISFLKSLGLKVKTK